jgi:hypothetical protein
MSRVVALVPADLVNAAVKQKDPNLPGGILTDLVEGEVPDLAGDVEQHPHNLIHVRFGDGSGSGRLTEPLPFPRDKITLILKTI